MRRTSLPLTALGTVSATALVTLLSGASATAAGSGGDAITGPTPFTSCTADHGDDQIDPNTEVEPWLVANPRDPRHLVSIWQQDRRSYGNARGIIAGVSRDGGQTWKRAILPGFTLCTDGPYNRSGGPWVTFAPNGDLYATASSFSWPGNSAVLVSKSTDGGATWGAPVQAIIDEGSKAWNDKPTITAHPRDPRQVFAVWNRREIATDRHDAMMARSRDGGRTWDKPISIHHPERAHQATLGNQIVVLPNGTLVNVFVENEFPIGGPPMPPEDLAERVRVVRSTDGGATWSKAVTIREHKLNAPSLPDDATKPVPQPGIIPDIAVDARTGAVHVVWAENGLSRSKSAVGHSTSVDGGRTWTRPVKINKTPDSAPGGNGQAFLPAVDVAGNGTVAITYYDFRRNTPAAGTPTDLWMITSRNGRFWRERHLAGSFDMERATQWGGPYLGGYYALTHVPGAFLSAYPATNSDPDNKQDIFFLRTSARP
ncbi:sialidase family protein [Spirillospora sp. CA-294931]|uniref:sialidase family protein n=1 Tax=Spirillospora sp. CA-294931 TaxID=3240042 RepID=UPI003D94D79A